MSSIANSKVVYTCITQNYDEVPLNRPSGEFDFVCFLDEETINKNKSLINNSTGIIFKKLPMNAATPQEANRILKILPHKFLGQYDESIYIDGNIKLHDNPFNLINELMIEKPVALYSQPHRNCAYSEIDELVRVGIARGVDASKLKVSMKTLGMERNYGLFEANIIFRKHNNQQCIFLMNLWWRLWERATLKRDQPFLAFTNFLTDQKIIQSMGYSMLLENSNPYFYYDGRNFKKSRIKRLIRRIFSEILIYKKN